jgi:hypothetical protein
MSLETHEYAPSGNRWRWILLALMPGLASDAMFVGWLLGSGAQSDLVASLATGLLYAAVLLPFVAPFYLSEVGRRYVRAVHAGYQSTTPFVVMYGVVNFGLWLGGILLCLANVGYR